MRSVTKYYNFSHKLISQKIVFTRVIKQQVNHTVSLRTRITMHSTHYILAYIYRTLSLLHIHINLKILFRHGKFIGESSSPQQLTLWSVMSFSVVLLGSVGFRV